MTFVMEPGQAPDAFGWSKSDPRVPFSYKGIPFPAGVNAHPGVAVIFTAALDALVPHIPGGLVNGWCWGADDTDKVGDSFHLYGLALDVNAPDNPQTSQPHPFGKLYELPSNTAAILEPFFIEWGGSWSTSTPKDYMHLQLKLNPADATAFAATLVHTPVPVPPKPPAPHSQYTPWQNTPAAHRTVQEWDDGTDVESLQKTINAWYPHRTPALTVDGYFGPATRAAVVYNQTLAGVTDDGIVGPVTWKELGYVVAY